MSLRVFGEDPARVALRDRELVRLGSRPRWYRPFARRAWVKQHAAIQAMDVSYLTRLFANHYPPEKVEEMARAPTPVLEDWRRSSMLTLRQLVRRDIGGITCAAARDYIFVATAIGEDIWRPADAKPERAKIVYKPDANYRRGGHCCGCLSLGIQGGECDCPPESPE